MSVYITSLFIAIPSFILLIFLEIIVSRIKGIEVNNHSDMISSLSSGLTNTIQASLKFGFIIISYSWLVDKITLFKLEPLWIAIIIAFIVEDFAGYWMHRLNHRVNIFWNRHIIHHSSEEFNLACALRQSISTTFRFSAILMIPAALLGIPASIFAVLGPIHLFMQFWYHTRLISRLGILEYILVTPSHHRVHHAINKEYLDKNYSQIFIIWDKLFNTFQVELDNVKPVYGTLRPVSTWNPIVINFKHFFQLVQDAWHTEKFIDKIKLWFKPTGWRPEDVKIKFPLLEIDNPSKQVKYRPLVSNHLVVWSWVQHIITAILMFHLFIVLDNQSNLLNYLYGSFLFINIFTFTSLLDKKKYTIKVETLKLFSILLILYYQNYSWFGLQAIYSCIIFAYFLIAFLISFSFHNKYFFSGEVLIAKD
jgi:alkylglycerol monooxygenase